MTTAGMLIVFAGYAVISYGYVLIRGYDITWKAWLDPLNPYQWNGTPTPIPATQVFPS